MSGGTAAPQVRNTEMVDILSTDFVKRNEATLAWGKACSMFQMLPGLRGFWPMSSVDENGNAIDLSGQGRTLSYHGNPFYAGSVLRSFITLDGTGDYLSRADEAGLDIIGTESYISTGLQGLTFGGWFYTTTVAAGSRVMMGKSNSATNNRSFIQLYSGASAISRVSPNGTVAAQVSVTSSETIAINTWYFIVTQYKPSTKLSIWVNDVETQNLVGVPVALYSSNAPLEIGAENGAALHVGSTTLNFLCAACLPDRVIKALYHHTRSLFGYV